MGLSRSLGTRTKVVIALLLALATFFSSATVPKSAAQVSGRVTISSGGASGIQIAEKDNNLGRSIPLAYVDILEPLTRTA